MAPSTVAILVCQKWTMMTLHSTMPDIDKIISVIVCRPVRARSAQCDFLVQKNEFYSKSRLLSEELPCELEI